MVIQGDPPEVNGNSKKMKTKTEIRIPCQVVPHMTDSMTLILHIQIPVPEPMNRAYGLAENLYVKDGGEIKKWIFPEQDRRDTADLLVSSLNDEDGNHKQYMRAWIVLRQKNSTKVFLRIDGPIHNRSYGLRLNLRSTGLTKLVSTILKMQNDKSLRVARDVPNLFN